MTTDMPVIVLPTYSDLNDGVDILFTDRSEQSGNSMLLVKCLSSDVR